MRVTFSSAPAGVRSSVRAQGWGPHRVPGAVVLLEVRSPQPHALLAGEHLQGVGVDGTCALQRVVGHTLGRRDGCESPQPRTGLRAGGPTASARSHTTGGPTGNPVREKDAPRGRARETPRATAGAAAGGTAAPAASEGGRLCDHRPHTRAPSPKRGVAQSFRDTRHTP